MARNSGVAGGGGGSGILAVVQYAPAVYTGLTTTSGSLAAIDATHLTIPFTAPASGKVLVRLVGHGLNTSGNNLYWALLDHTSHSQVGYTWSVNEGANGSSLAAEFYITGLTGAMGYQYDWAHAVSGGTGYFVCQGYTTIAGAQVDAAPAVLTVWSA